MHMSLKSTFKVVVWEVYDFYQDLKVDYIV